MSRHLFFSMIVSVFVLVGIHQADGAQPEATPDPTTNPTSPLMLDLPETGTDPTRISFDRLTRIPSRHAVISDMRPGKRVNQHAYLAHYDGRFWAMWSDGPALEDRPDQRVFYSTSPDGLNWTSPQDMSGPPKKKGFGYISRGFWQREGELLTLMSHFNAPGYPGKGLSLDARHWNRQTRRWEDYGTVQDDALNNFPPKKLPSGEWMMSRRDHQRRVSMLIGGVEAYNQWEIVPVAAYGGKNRPEEPYWYILPDGKNLVALFRDNSGGKRLGRAFSTNNGRGWSAITKTNFPDATSKFNVLRTSRGDYVLVSNANPRRRDPLTLSISKDGLVYTDMFYLVGGEQVDYPHLLEHDGSLFVSFSRGKQTVEVLKMSLDTIDKLRHGASGRRK